jgi:Heliorhodopsin
MTAAAPAINSVTAAPIAQDRAKSLFRWNAILAVLHALQGLIILVISFVRDPIVSSPVVSSYLTFDTATQSLVQAQRTLFELPIGPAVATFFFMSAIAHALLAWPLRRWYEDRLAANIQPMRWIEYALSSSVMIVVIAALAGIQEIGTLIAIFGVNAAMNLFGWSMESANQGRAKTQWNHYIFGVIAGVVPWIVIGTALWSASTAPGAAPIPGFIFAIFGSLFIAFNIFAITMVLQYRKIGRWQDYLVGEKRYMFLSLFAKTLLAWQVFAGTLRP